MAIYRQDMKLDPRQLEVLAAIVDGGGLTDGADALGRSQPSLSRTVALMEARVGAALFQPGRRPLLPTELGLMLAEHGRRIRAAGQAAGEAVDRWRAGRSGAVRAGGTPVFMDGVIAGMIAGFQVANPEVTIDQSHGYAADLSERLLKDRLDLAICPLRGGAAPAGLSFEPVLAGRNVIACRTGHPLLARRALRAGDMARHPWIAPPSDSPLYQDLRQVLASLGAEDFRISFSGGGLSSVMGILTASDALTVLPYSVVFTLRRQYAIATLPVRIDHPDRDLGLLHRGREALSPVARRLCAHIAAQFVTLAATIAHHERQAIWGR